MESNTDVQAIFDGMAAEYDDISDPWHAWLFARVHLLVAKAISGFSSCKTVLDVGCGTGFQSFLYAAAGHRVVGVDISPGLIDIARSKAAKLEPSYSNTVLPSIFGFASRAEIRINSILQASRCGSPTRPDFVVGNAMSLPFKDATFDHINCCGSTLSLLHDYTAALEEFARVLRPGGTFILDVEGRYNLDAIWTIVDSLSGGWFGFESTVSEAWQLLSRPRRSHVVVRYPFPSYTAAVPMVLVLFSCSLLRAELSKVGLHPYAVKSVHAITNLLPSTVSSRPLPNRGVCRTFEILAAIESLVPIRLPACSLVFIGERVNAGDKRTDGAS